MTARILFQDTNKGFMDGLMKTEAYLKRSGIAPALQELIKFRVSQINGCAYCLDMHYKDAIHMGETEQRLYSLAAWRDAPFYTDAERAALAFAEVLTKANSQDVEDDVYEALSQFFSKGDIADLALVVGQINTWNRINKTFRTVPGDYKPA
ncbi:carboxymuconolactone decarboxylase family protein [Chitinophaga nivalis]|uniref:Carboxymuconolactone decarboxylase family protein n=1 Tax=Chitinophaga nivalis TaxID=2991709 RepID=A0ABT3IWF0_9BACT|nr:carboxymuconolactone decarboxylase family protein [Chitinophaga nivalis]MCW3462016.1 carboxymuconolactone decarboxylase family protein [Chitinophaga nivalis]MCW3488292.1 carboxymuconolactone decarboxylase family protein [Chitinophaga nivalis]